MHYVAVGDDVFLAFEAHAAGVAGTGFAVERDVVVIGDGFGTDEAFFEIGVNRSCRLRRAGISRHGPGARFLRTRGEEGD